MPLISHRLRCTDILTSLSGMVYCKKSSDKKWVEIHGYNADETASIKPGKAVPYNVCVKVKDEIGTVQKKYFDIEVDE